MKLKVLHIIPDFKIGGAQRLVLDLLKNLNKDLFEVAAISLYGDSDSSIEKEIKDKNLKVWFLDKHKGLDFRMIKRLYEIIKMYRPDIIHTHRYVLRYVLPVLILINVPVKVHTIHNIALKEVDFIGKIIHWFAFRYGGVIPVSISKEVAKSVKRLYGRKIITPIIYNGISTWEFRRRYEQNTEKKNLIFGCIARLEPQKNHLLLLKAFSRILEIYPNLELWIVGDGSLRFQLEEFVNKNNLKAKVIFKGLRYDIPEILSQIDIFILSSNWEGFPVSILEAMSLGIPVVATSVGGIPELINNMKNGILIPPNNEEALASALLRLINSPELRIRLGEEARKTVLSKFDIAVIAKEYEALYLNLYKNLKSYYWYKSEKIN